MDILLRAGLLLVLGLFTLFSYKAPNGMKAMGALANTACSSFLVEAFNQVLIAALRCIIVSVFSGFVGYYIFKNFKIHTAGEIRSSGK